MVRIYATVQLSHPRLREFAVVAAWIATLAEAANDVEDLIVDVPPEERVLPARACLGRGTSIRSSSPSRS
jgi:hypothetical protein